MANVKDFSIDEKLKAVIVLQKIDSKIDEINTIKGELPMEIKDLEDEIAGLQTRVSNTDTEIQEINDYIQQRTEAKKAAIALAKKYEKQQDNVKNNREFEAISKEIEVQELDAKLCDKNIKDSNFELTKREEQRIKTNEKISIVEESLKLKQDELAKIIVDTKKEEEELNIKSTEAKEKVDERLLTAYERIRKSYSNGLAVVSVHRESCGGCFNVIPPQRQSEIKQRKKIIVCEHCGRILVDAELEEQAKLK